MGDTCEVYSVGKGGVGSNGRSVGIFLRGDGKVPGARPRRREVPADGEVPAGGGSRADAPRGGIGPLGVGMGGIDGDASGMGGTGSIGGGLWCDADVRGEGGGCADGMGNGFIDAGGMGGMCGTQCGTGGLEINVHVESSGTGGALLCDADVRGEGGGCADDMCNGIFDAVAAVNRCAAHRRTVFAVMRTYSILQRNLDYEICLFHSDGYWSALLAFAEAFLVAATANVERSAFGQTLEHALADGLAEWQSCMAITNTPESEEAKYAYNFEAWDV